MSATTPGNCHAAVTPRGVDQLPSGRFRARVTVNGRQVPLGTFATMTAAGRAAEQERARISSGNWVDPRRSRISLDEWMTLWWPARSVRPQTQEKDQERYRVHIQPYLGHVPLVGITPFQVQRWLTDLRDDGRNPPTVKKAHTLLATALGVKGAVGDQRLGVNPCVIVRPATPARPDWTLLTATQIGALLTEIPEHWRTFVMLAADSGLRWSELTGLRRADFTLRGEIFVQRSRDPKGRVQPTKNRRTRTVPLPARTVTALHDHCRGLAPDAWMFTAPQGGMPSAHNFTYRVWKPALDKTGLTARIHDLRHSYASRLLEGGATPAQVRDLCGHSSITVTEIYLHTSQESLAGAVLRAIG